MPIKRVTTREFLRDINSMTEPVEVYTRSTLKGTWLPNTTWSTDLEAAGASIGALREAVGAAAQADPSVPTSEPRSVRADAGGTPNAVSAFGASRPAPKPAKKKAVHRKSDGWQPKRDSKGDPA